MAQMGEYCKAYLARQFRAYEHWVEQTENMSTETKIVDGKEVEILHEIEDDTVLYLHENYVVTDGIYMTKHIIFDAVTPEWKTFCREMLAFEIPTYEISDITEEVDTSTG